MKQNEFVLIKGTDYEEMTRKLLEEIDLAGMIGDRGKRIGIKPNLVSDSPADEGATTHPEIVSGLLSYLQEHGFSDLLVMEGSWVGSSTMNVMRVNGLDRVVRKYNVPFCDLQKDRTVIRETKGFSMEICETALSVDYLISLPVLKGHMQTRVTCALKNMKGLISNSEKRKFHRMGLHKPIAALNTVLRADLFLVDHICGDPDCEDGGNPEVRDVIFVCRDPVLCDAFACRELGYSVNQVEYIGLAEKYGVGSADLSKAMFRWIGEGETEDAERDHRTEALRAYIDEDSACSACYGMLMEALLVLDREGLLEWLPGKISIGQGFRGKTGEIGFGQCTGGFRKSLQGCPPTKEEAVRFLTELCV
ncbi:MAG: DUF362 domain-containing protein [Lachnospiraceae bacterium]|nr:DUF362 domain-containing protein [Lachnospiraceae bacterium]